MKAALLPYSGYKPSAIPWLGDVPDHWEVTRCKALLSSIDIRSQTGDEDLLTVSAQHGVVPRESATVTMFKAESYVGHKLCWPGDLVINSLWAWAGGLGVSQHHGIVSTAYGVFRPQPDVVPKFVHFLVRSSPFQWELQVRSKGIWLSRLQLSDELFLTAPVPLPPLTEQRAIVRYLDYMDQRIHQYISAKRRLVRLLTEERLGVMQEVLQSQGVIPQRLRAITELINRPIERIPDQEYTPIGLYNRGRGFFLKRPTRGYDLGDSDFSWIEENDVIISGQFAWEGAVALASDAEHGCIASHRYHILRCRPGISDSGFLLSFFQTTWGELLLDHHSRGAAGRNRPLNVRCLLREEILLPPIEAQHRVSELLRRETYIRRQVALSEQLLKEFRTRIVADVVTGKLDVREAAAQLPSAGDDQDSGEDHDLVSDGELVTPYELEGAVERTVL